MVNKINTIKLFTKLAVLSQDMHTKSTRPCDTCLGVSKEMGLYFGCYALIEKKGDKSLLPKLEDKTF